MAQTRKLEKTIWAEFAGRCAICRQSLIIDTPKKKSKVLVGEIAHIVSESHRGPRGKHDLSNEDKKNTGNYLLLCGPHHKEIDDNEEHYTPDALKKLRATHIEWIRSNLVEPRPVSISLSALTYINVPRLSELAARYGFRINPETIGV